MNKKYLKFPFVLFFLLFSLGNYFCKSQDIESRVEQFAIAMLHTPVLNTSDFESVFGGESGDSLKLDEEGHIMALEFIAIPNTVFKIHETIPKQDHIIYRITTTDYPYTSTELFIDSRFVNVSNKKSKERKIEIPSRDEIINNMLSLEGCRYLWGGNFCNGITEMLSFYKPKNILYKEIEDNWCLRGVDCSGLIYQTTDGATPRNTSSLVNYGTGLNISGKTDTAIQNMLKPLDLIVWKGHVIIVLDEKTAIESRPPKGVQKNDLLNRLKEVMEERQPVDDWDSSEGERFVVRRWVE
ncbi:MAG: peptidoglycan endopeptidase [Ignavibacteria bacterium]|nr:peptidoglycan endopeptidase [Ignavibacteria bacterium]